MNPPCFGSVSPTPDPECVPCDFRARCRASQLSPPPTNLVQVTADGHMFKNAVSGLDGSILTRYGLRKGGTFEQATGLTLRWCNSGKYRLKAVDGRGRMVVGFVRLDCRACELDFKGTDRARAFVLGAEAKGAGLWVLRCHDLERRWDSIVTMIALRSGSPRKRQSRQPARG